MTEAEAHLTTPECGQPSFPAFNLHPEPVSHCAAGAGLLSTLSSPLSSADLELALLPHHRGVDDPKGPVREGIISHVVLPRDDEHL